MTCRTQTLQTRHGRLNTVRSTNIRHLPCCEAGRALRKSYHVMNNYSQKQCETITIILEHNQQFNSFRLSRINSELLSIIIYRHELDSISSEVDHLKNNETIRKSSITLGLGSSCATGACVVKRRCFHQFLFLAFNLKSVSPNTTQNNFKKNPWTKEDILVKHLTLINVSSLRPMNLK